MCILNCEPDYVWDTNAPKVEELPHMVKMRDALAKILIEMQLNKNEKNKDVKKMLSNPDYVKRTKGQMKK